MPESAEQWSKFALFCLLTCFILMRPEAGSEAASIGFRTDRDIEGASFIFGTRLSAISLIGFPCSPVSTSTKVFTADPDYRETASTVGLELFSEADSLAAAGASTRREMDDASAVETKTALSVTLRRAIIRGGEALPLSEADEVEEIPLSGASMSVAGLMALCQP